MSVFVNSVVLGSCGFFPSLGLVCVIFFNYKNVLQLIL